MSMIGARNRLYTILTEANYTAAVAAINALTGTVGSEYFGVAIAVFAGHKSHATQQAPVHPWLYVIPADAEVNTVHKSGSEIVVHGFRVVVEDRAQDTDSVYSQIMAHAAAVRQVVQTYVRTPDKYFLVRVPRWDFSGVFGNGQGVYVAQVELRIEIYEDLSINDVTD